ncbi:GH25 family lysozyme [Pseudobutyrivibrio ruminis]|uniref:GH25 family lysozyme n=1 Tax=Pseudobutyrivibrio ruminis TaxID=46206 RepID=UPI00040D1074|nr:GH25 family lysozyme [Pseudobutyrivibrio ruminis]
MNEIWETIRFFIASHKVASIAVASVLGATAVGAGGYGVYNLITADDVAEVVDVEDDYQAEDVYIPEFKNVVITSESLEKDLTVYISDENDNPISGVPFQVKLLTKEAAEGLQSYVDAIKDLDAQIAEYTKDYADLDVSADTQAADDSSAESVESNDSDALPVDGNGIDFEKLKEQQAKKRAAAEAEDKAKSGEKEEAKTEESESSEGDESAEHPSIDASELPSDSAKITRILQDRNVDVTVTDKDGNVIETQHGDISSDPLYMLYLDKETALQSYAVALKEAEGTVYTDDDEDGVISEKDMEPGDYVLALLNDTDSEVSYEPTEYATEAEVKDKVEFKVQKEITKQIKKDNAAEDGQKKEKVPVEETLKDTVEFVESRKVENGHSAKGTTDVVAPKMTAKASKATLKTDKGLLTRKHTLKAAEAAKFKITINFELKTADDKDVKTVTIEKAKEYAKDSAISYTAPDTYKDGDVTYKKVSGPSPAFEKVTKDATYTFVYKAEETTPVAKPKHTVKVYYKLGESKTEISSKEVTKEEGEEVTITADSTYKSGDDEYKLDSDSSQKVTIGTADSEVVFNYKKIEKAQEPVVDEPQPENPTGYRAHGAVAASFRIKDKLIAAKIRRIIAVNASTGVKEETATIEISYKEGVFTVNATAGALAKVTVNGADVAVKDSKTATFAATKDGDYAFVATPKWTDNVPATDAELLKATYTVSGFGTATTEQLKDKAGNALFLDEGLSKPATAADYVAGKTYYYKAATYTYYGWQSIDGNTFYFDKNGNKVTGSQVIQGVKYDFGADGVLIVKGNGIDVSKHQGNIDWKAAKSAINFAIIRCGYRGMHDGQLHEDPFFYKNMSGAKAAGINVGVYIYSTALNEAEAVQEASMAVAMAGRAGGCSYPIYLDMEDTVRGQSSLSVEQRMAIVNAFVNTVQSSGYKAGLYCSKNWMTARMNPNGIPGSCSVWIAQYNTSCTYSGRKNMWQYSSKGSVPGIKGHVDMNKSF